jgi:hypothetical protein
VFPGYLVLGGTEVFNQARTYAYVEESGCPAGWLRCLPCPGLEDALGVNSYVGTLADAPWYDDADPATHKFFGIYPIAMDGLDSSTRTANIQEGILDGGVIQGTRRAVREIRVRGVMVGDGQDGLDAGLSWLDAVLDGNTCSTHQGACGEVDGCFWVTCPPERPTMTDYTPFDVVSRNLALDPSARVATTASWSSDGATASRVAGTTFSATYAARFTATTATVRVGPKASLAASTQHSVRLKARTSKAWTGWTLNYRPSGPTSTTGEVIIATGLSMSTTPVTLEYTFTTTGTAPGASASVVLISTTASVSDWVEIAEVMVAAGAAAPDFFDGATTDTAIAQYSWVGTADASASTFEARSAIQVPVPDATYDAVLDPLRRRMHGLTAISGPLVVQHFHNSNYHAYEIEFTLAAATPYIYGEPKALTLAPTSPSVVQDSPFNLVPYPSAELAEAANLVVATNYATNPSAEVNTTDWTLATAVVSGTAPTAFTVLSRTTELFAAGTASVRVRLLGDNGTTAVAAAVSTIDAYQDASLPAGTGRRASISVWSSVLILGGSSPGTLVNSLITTYEFFNGAASLGAATTFGTASTTDYNGRAFSVKSVAVPATATKVRVRARANVTWTSAAGATNSDIRLYVDALAVTIP